MFRIRRRFRDAIGRCSWLNVDCGRSLVLVDWAAPAFAMEIRVRLGGMSNAPWGVEELLAVGRLMEARPEGLRKVAAGGLGGRERGGGGGGLRSNVWQGAV